MQRRESILPPWAGHWPRGKKIVMSRYDGYATHGLIERSWGAQAFWQVSGYAPGDRRVLVYAYLTDSEAQRVFDADPQTTSFLEPVWSTIRHNVVTVRTEDLDGRKASVNAEIPRDVSVSQFLNIVETLADKALKASRLGVAGSHKVSTRRKSSSKNHIPPLGIRFDDTTGVRILEMRGDLGVSKISHTGGFGFEKSLRKSPISKQARPKASNSVLENDSMKFF